MIGDNKNRGFVLLFSVLLTGIILSIGLAMANIALKEVIFSSTARESVSAFYAAATGRECAIYWDVQKSAFGIGDPAPFNQVITCNGQSSSGSEIRIDFPNGACAKVTVQKLSTQGLLPDQPNTKITSLGYNVCTDSPKKVERGVVSSYRI